MSGQPNNDGPNWLGLLQWSLAHQDGTAPSNVEMMARENQEWLERVLREGVVDEPRRIAEVVAALRAHLAADAVQEADAELLGEVADITDQIDMAGVFAKLGGLKMVFELVASYGSLSSLSEPVLVAALALAGAVCQNHPEVQKQAVEAAPGYSQSLLDAVVHLLRNSDALSAAAQSKALFAVSCMVRGERHAESLFVSRHCGELFRAVLARPAGATSGVIGRLCFLSRALLASPHASRERVRLIGAVMLPVCPGGILSADVNTRDSACGLVSELCGSADGREALTAHAPSIEASVDSVLMQLQQQLTDATNDDDKAFIAEDISNMTIFKNDLVAAKLGRGCVRSIEREHEVDQETPALLLGPA